MVQPAVSHTYGPYQLVWFTVSECSADVIGTADGNEWFVVLKRYIYSIIYHEVLTLTPCCINYIFQFRYDGYKSSELHDG
jgi:hypothetical protein